MRVLPSFTALLLLAAALAVSTVLAQATCTLSSLGPKIDPVLYDGCREVLPDRAMVYWDYINLVNSTELNPADRLRLCIEVKGTFGWAGLSWGPGLGADAMVFYVRSSSGAIRRQDYNTHVAGSSPSLDRDSQRNIDTVNALTGSDADVVTFCGERDITTEDNLEDVDLATLRGNSTLWWAIGDVEPNSLASITVHGANSTSRGALLDVNLLVNAPPNPHSDEEDLSSDDAATDSDGGALNIGDTLPAWVFVGVIGCIPLSLVARSLVTDPVCSGSRGRAIPASSQAQADKLGVFTSNAELAAQFQAFDHLKWGLDPGKEFPDPPKRIRRQFSALETLLLDPSLSLVTAIADAMAANPGQAPDVARSLLVIFERNDETMTLMKWAFQSARFRHPDSTTAVLAADTMFGYLLQAYAMLYGVPYVHETLRPVLQDILSGEQFLPGRYFVPDLGGADPSDANNLAQLQPAPITIAEDPSRRSASAARAAVLDDEVELEELVAMPPAPLPPFIPDLDSEGAPAPAPPETPPPDARSTKATGRRGSVGNAVSVSGKGSKGSIRGSIGRSAGRSAATLARKDSKGVLVTRLNSDKELDDPEGVSDSAAGGGLFATAQLIFDAINANASQMPVPLRALFDMMISEMDVQSSGRLLVTSWMFPYVWCAALRSPRDMRLAQEVTTPVKRLLGLVSVMLYHSATRTDMDVSSLRVRATEQSAMKEFLSTNWKPMALYAERISSFDIADIWVSEHIPAHVNSHALGTIYSFVHDNLAPISNGLPAVTARHLKELASRAGTPPGLTDKAHPRRTKFPLVVSALKVAPTPLVVGNRRDSSEFLPRRASRASLRAAQRLSLRKMAAANAAGHTDSPASPRKRPDTPPTGSSPMSAASLPEVPNVPAAPSQAE